MPLGVPEETEEPTPVLIWKAPRSYTPWLKHQRSTRPLLGAALRFLLIFALSIIFMVVSLKTLLPPIDAADRDHVKIPKSFEDLKNLNAVLQIYKERNSVRVLSSFTIVCMFLVSWMVMQLIGGPDLFLQAFSLPGSMYLSILSGAMYGFKALFLVCAVSISSRSPFFVLILCSASHQALHSATSFPPRSVQLYYSLLPDGVID